MVTSVPADSVVVILNIAVACPIHNRLVQAVVQSGNNPTVSQSFENEQLEMQCRGAEEPAMTIFREMDAEGIGRLRNTVSRALNPKPFHEAAQSIGMDVENCPRAVRPADHPAGSFEHPEDMLLLHLFE